MHLRHGGPGASKTAIPHPVSNEMTHIPPWMDDRAAPNGRPVHENFAEWFADSKVVGAGGEPLVVYHGTDAEFDTFEFTEDIGFHFGSAETAATRILQAQMEDDGITLAVYLRLRNPLRLPDLHTWSPRSVVSALLDAGVISEDQADAADVIDREQVASWLADKGYDSIVYRNETEAGGDSWIAMEPEQIKSATSNNGNYDPANPSMTEERSTPALTSFAP